jgi:hypothetical protein
VRWLWKFRRVYVYLSFPFAADFFAAIRDCFIMRAEDPRFKRLTFVLLGVARPTELIGDPKRTPFNVGQGIDLTDFTAEEAFPLSEGLVDDPAGREAALGRVLHWTGGHPYLTQKVCQLAARSADGTGGSSAHAPIDPEVIDRVVDREFLAPGSDRREDNLRSVRDRVAGRGALSRRMLGVYLKVLGGKTVADEPTSPAYNELKLAGLVKPCADGTLAVRNRIYKQVFGPRWVQEATPPDWGIRAAVMFGWLLLLSLAVIGGWLYLR